MGGYVGYGMGVQGGQGIEGYGMGGWGYVLGV